MRRSTLLLYNAFYPFFNAFMKYCSDHEIYSIGSHFLNLFNFIYLENIRVKNMKRNIKTFAHL